jgi:hypothetical protein
MEGSDLWGSPAPPFWLITTWGVGKAKQIPGLELQKYQGQHRKDSKQPLHRLRAGRGSCPLPCCSSLQTLGNFPLSVLTLRPQASAPIDWISIRNPSPLRTALDKSSSNLQSRC